MSLIAQLLRPVPPLPPVCSPGWNGAVYRHAMFKVVEVKTPPAASFAKVNAAHEEETKRKRIAAIRAINAGARTVRELADRMQESYSQAAKYVRWLADEKLIVVDKSTMPRTLKPIRR
jgi:hypothetical protein